MGEMEKHTSDRHVKDELAALALGILDSTESQRIHEHLSKCDECRKELAGFQSTAASLATLVPQVDPPARLKSSILATISSAQEKAPWTERLKAFFTPPGAILRVGGLALILVLLFSNLVLWNRVNELSRMQRHGYASVLLDPTQIDPDASGMVIYTLDGRYGLLVVDNLDPLPPEMQYQLWLIHSEKRTDGGVFSVGRGGYFVMMIESPELLTRYDGFGITIEPAGGSSGPTGEKVLGGSF